MNTGGYVHGYDPRENQRLQDQALTLEELLHGDTAYPTGARILEAGCGVGAQTIALARNSPGAEILSIDISVESIRAARNRIAKEGFSHVTFRQADIFALPFEEQSFDHVFVCFVLEHLSEPIKALNILKKYIRPGGTITIIEGDHGSTFMYPDSRDAHLAIQALVDLQKCSGGNANIGRELYPLLKQSGFTNISVSPRMVYVDSSRPEYVEGFTRKTFAAMIEGVRDDAVHSGLIDTDTMDQGIRDLYRAAETDGVFCYTFFKAVATISLRGEEN